MACMYIIWFILYLFYWRLVLMMSLSLRSGMIFILFQFPVSWWLDMAYKTCLTVVGSFLPILRIQTLVLILAGLLYGILFSDWEIYYDMLWCSQYCVTISMGVPLGGKLKLTSNISHLIKGWSERSIFNLGRVEISVPSISSEPGDQNFPYLLLCSLSFADE